MSSINREKIREAMTLYGVTDSAWETEDVTLYEQVEEALRGGVTCIQIREKEATYEEFLEKASDIVQLCKQYKVPCLINDEVELAVVCNADGVHVGQSDMKADNVREKIGTDKILGVTIKSVEEALEAQAHGADYIGVGAMFNTSTKLDVDTIDHQLVKEICNAVDIPVVAIGGIGASNLHQLEGLGIDGVAVVSAIFASDDITEACKKLKLQAIKVASN